MTTVDLAAAAEQIRQHGAEQPFQELVEGAWFLAQPPTPLLSRTLTRFRDAVAAGAHAAGLQIAVSTHEPMLVGQRSMVVPDLLVRDGGGRIALVVELRSESTERYALGIKRLAYQSAGVPEYWFAEPRAGRVLTLLSPPGSFDYDWPPQVRGPGDMLSPRALPGIHVEVADVFEPLLAEAAAAPLEV